jgi:hypothetical protein
MMLLRTSCGMVADESQQVYVLCGVVLHQLERRSVHRVVLR